MLSLNKVMLVGNLTRDPELRHTTNGNSVASLSVAVNESYKNKEGEWVKSTAFFNIVIWGKAAENVAKYCQKGFPVWVEGKLSNRSYETQSGEKRTVTEIVATTVQNLADRKAGTEESAGHGGSTAGADSASHQAGRATGSLYENMDSDMDDPPF